MTQTGSALSFGQPAGGHDPLPPDPEADADLAPVNPPNYLESLEAELQADIEAPTLTLPVPYRPGWTVTYTCGIDAETGKEWAKRAADKKDPSGINRLYFAQLVLANLATAVRKNGEPIGKTGDDIDFRTPDLWRLLGADRAAEAVRLFYGGPKHLGDGHIMATAGQVTTLAGYGDDLVDGGRPDPTSS